MVFAGIRALWPSVTPDVGALVRDGGTYLRGSGDHHGQYGNVAAWGIGLLTTAVVLAYLATKPKIRRRLEWLTGPYPHDSTVSAWWILFERGPRIEMSISLACLITALV